MKYDVINIKQIFSRGEHKSDAASLKSPDSHCVLVQQKQPIGSMQPETRSLPQRASHRPQSRDTPRVLLNQASREPQPATRPFSANIHRPAENNQVRHTDHFVGPTFLRSYNARPLEIIPQILKSYMFSWAVYLHSVSLLRVNINLQRGRFPQISQKFNSLSSDPSPATSHYSPLQPSTARTFSPSATQTQTQNRMKQQAGISHTSHNMFCLVTTTWALVGAEICPPSRLPQNNLHFKINSAAQQQGSSNGRSILGQSFINCTICETQNHTWIIGYR